ncbi:MAG: hypothetical protein ACI33N_03205 [Desulfovibrionaceae bacterium]
MRDERGLYYFPQAGNVKAKMYVRRNGGEIEFRLWQADYPEVWEKHCWLPMGVIRRAAALYTQGKGPDAADPTRLYDVQVAEALIAEAER